MLFPSLPRLAQNLGGIGRAARINTDSADNSCCDSYQAVRTEKALFEYALVADMRIS